MGDIEVYDLVINTDHVGHVRPGIMRGETEFDCLIVTMIYGEEFSVDPTFLQMETE